MMESWKKKLAGTKTETLKKQKEATNDINDMNNYEW